MSSTLYLLWGIAALAFAAAAWFPGRRVGYLAPLYFFGGWLAGELALQVALVHGVVTMLFAAGGALSTGAGVFALACTLSASALLVAAHLRALRARDEVALVARAGDFHEELDERPVSLVHGIAHPFRMKHPAVNRIRDIPYGPVLPGDRGGRNLLDVVTPSEPGELRPALLQIHGGGWVIGDKQQQGGPLMTYLAERGWVSFAINYRLSPQATFPDHIIDVKRAIGWIREHAREYGADPDFLCVTGGSAGGHLAALTALSANDPAFQPGFEEVDTHVDAAVPFYGVFDFRDRAGIRGTYSMEPFLAKRVFKCTPEEDPELWDAMSPITRCSAEAPPFLVVQGTHDTLVFVEEAREFVRVLREKSQNAVHYLEMDGGQHAFETFHSVRSAHAVRTVAAFLDRVHRQARERNLEIDTRSGISSA